MFSKPSFLRGYRGGGLCSQIFFLENHTPTPTPTPWNIHGHESATPFRGRESSSVNNSALPLSVMTTMLSFSDNDHSTTQISRFTSHYSGARGLKCTLRQVKAERHHHITWQLSCDNVMPGQTPPTRLTPHRVNPLTHSWTPSCPQRCQRRQHVHDSIKPSRLRRDRQKRADSSVASVIQELPRRNQCKTCVFNDPGKNCNLAITAARPEDSPPPSTTTTSKYNFIDAPYITSNDFVAIFQLFSEHAVARNTQRKGRAPPTVTSPDHRHMTMQCLTSPHT